MELGFGGEVARLYDRYRRSYPDAVLDEIVSAFDLTADDTAVDLGCGTGQLTRLLATRLRHVIGVDPEPDMLAVAAQHSGITWVLGTDADLPALAGANEIGVVTAATALHWMQDEQLFADVARLARPGGGFAVVTNGKPLWQLDVPWSHALRAFLESWTGHEESYGCGTDDEAQQRYRDHLAAAGLTVSEASVDYVADLMPEQLTGSMLTTFPIGLLPAGEARQRFSDGIRNALGDGPFEERVHVGLIFGRR